MRRMVGLVAVVLHVLTVFWLVAGIVGRDACWWHAVLVTGLAAAGLRGHSLFGFLRGEGPVWPFAALLIYLSIIPLIVLVFLPKGRVYQAALVEAESRGEVTSALRAAIEDPAVAAARGYEFVMIAVLAFLMIVKPF